MHERLDAGFEQYLLFRARLGQTQEASLHDRRVADDDEESAARRESTGAKVREYGQMFKLNPDVSDIADQFAVTHGGVALLVGAARNVALQVAALSRCRTRRLMPPGRRPGRAREA